MNEKLATKLFEVVKRKVSAELGLNEGEMDDVLLLQLGGLTEKQARALLLFGKGVPMMDIASDINGSRNSNAAVATMNAVTKKMLQSLILTLFLFDDDNIHLVKRLIERMGNVDYVKPLLKGVE